MFEGIEPRTVMDCESWLYGHGYHYQGDFRVQFASGGHVDLREVLADFAETYCAGLQGRVKAWQKIAEDAVAVKPVTPIIVSKGCNRHNDCAVATAEYKAKYGKDPGFSFHCHDDECEDCFGC